jgi:hypothetical protein
MRSLPLLVRLARQSADERRGDLGQIARATADASAALDDHDATAANEASRALADPDALAALVNWTPRAARNSARLRHRVTELERSKTAAREALREAVAGTRRLELAMESIQTANRRSALRRANQLADEHELARYTVGRAPG